MGIGGRRMKYIIKNSPAITKSTVCVDDKYSNLCQDITDCLMKQIAKLCNDVLEQETDPLNSFEMSFAQKILQLLEIEEVE